MLETFLRLRRVRTIGTGIALALTLTPLLIVQPVQAQLFRGYISGTVTDQTNSVLVGAEVTLISRDTSSSQTRMTNEKGFYRFVALDPGMYDIDFKKSGFLTKSVTSIEVKSSDEITINPGLSLTGTSTTVDVQDVPGFGLSKTNANIKMTLPGRTMDYTPLGTSSLFIPGSRNFGRYALFAPAVARVLGQNEFSTNGHRGRENNFMVDGVDNNDNSVTLPALFAPPEATQELQVQVATLSAEFGRNIGAQVNAVTRSGTNSFQGEAWEFYRGAALEPLSLQSQRVGLPRAPRLTDNQFGFDIGGPIIKGKTFFFGLAQGNRQRALGTIGAVTVPTAAGYDLLQTVPLRAASGNVAAQAAASRQAMLDALNFLPSVYPQIQRYASLSSVTVNSTSIPTGTFFPLVPQNQSLWYGLIRVDHQLTSNDRLAYRVHIDHRDSPLSTDNLAFGARWGADATYLAQNHALSYTRNIGQNLVNEMRFAYTRLEPTFVERDPVTSTSSLSGLFTIGGQSNFPQQRMEQTYQLQNVSSYIIGRHSLKLGFDLARTSLLTNTATNSKGAWSFSSLQTFLNSQPTSLTQLVSQDSLFTFHQLKQAYFFQDDIKVTKTFTANLGLRYETASIPLGFFGATDPTVLASNVPGPAKRDTNNWGPRVGFAYSPTFSNGVLAKVFGNSRSSIRGGFGVAYDVLFYSLLANPALNYPRNTTQTTSSASLVDVFPALAPKTAVPTFSAASTFVNIPSDAQNPTTNYWTLSVQRQIRTDFVLEAGYTGNRSYHLIRQGQANPGILTQAKADAVIAGCTALNLSSCQDPTGFAASPVRLDPTLGSRILLETTGEATYNAGYIQLDKRASFGLQFGGNYTWSSNFSDSEEFSNDIGSIDGGIAGSSPQVPQNFLNRHAEKSRSVFDRPQRFTIHMSYAIPFFSGTPKILQQAFSGWHFSAFTEIQSGQPFTITVGVDTLGSGSATPGRPNINPGGTLLVDPDTLNLRTFTIPLDGTGIVTAPHVTDSTGKVTFLKNSMPIGGSLPRNAFRGPGYSNTNVSLMKIFTLTKDRTLEIRGDFMNVFNHDNFPNPDANMSHTTFGKQIFVPLTDARQILLGAKIRF